MIHFCSVRKHGRTLEGWREEYLGKLLRIDVIQFHVKDVTWFWQHGCYFFLLGLLFWCYPLFLDCFSFGFWSRLGAVVFLWLLDFFVRDDWNLQNIMRRTLYLYGTRGTTAEIDVAFFTSSSTSSSDVKSAFHISWTDVPRTVSSSCLASSCSFLSFWTCSMVKLQIFMDKR